MIQLNLGCGSVRPDGWVNADSSLNAHLQKIPVIGKPLAKVFNPVQYDSKNVVYMNLNKRWPYKDNSVDVVYASHLFEHLSLGAAKLFLEESFRTLRPGGVIRIAVPDLYKLTKKYISEYESGQEQPSEYLMWAINMHREGQYGTPGFFKKLVFEWQGYPHQHKFMYDEKSLSKRFKEVGFRDIVPGLYGESKYIPSIKDVEGTKEAYISIYIEALKP